MNFKTIIMMGLLIANVYGQEFGSDDLFDIDLESGQSVVHSSQLTTVEDIANSDNVIYENNTDVRDLFNDVFDFIKHSFCELYYYIVDNREFIRAEIYSISREVFIGVMVEKLSRAHENNPT